MKNRGSHNEPDIYYRPTLRLGGDGLYWPSSLHGRMFNHIIYRFHETMYDERLLVTDFAARHLDPTQTDAYLLLPDGYRFSTVIMESRSFPYYEPSGHGPDAQLTLSKENKNNFGLRLRVRESSPGDTLTYAHWFMNLAHKHGQEVSVEVDEPVAVAS